MAVPRPVEDQPSRAIAVALPRELQRFARTKTRWRAGCEVTVLHDGQIKLDTKILKNLRAGEMQKLLALQFRNNPTPTAVNAFLVNTGKQLVLVDTGAAKVFGPTLGQVVANLKAAGYDPAQVDAVLLP